MITPSFSIAQDDKQLIFIIRAPYAKIAETEIEYADDLFMFSSPPYYLRVHLPREVIDDNSGTANYDSTLGEFTVHVPKKNCGESFPGLDMITELLNPQKSVSAQQMVEEVGSDDEDLVNGSEYLHEQKIADVSAGCTYKSNDNFGYGFAWRRKGVLGQLSKEIGDLVELTDPECTAIGERSRECLEKDQKIFDPERYLLDFLDPEETLQLAIQAEFHLQLDIDANDRQRLKDLPRKKLPRLSQKENYAIALSLIDMVFAFVYDSRINDWEMCCETGWNIIKLSPSLTFLCQWKNAKEAFTSAVRRSLCHPLFRSWDLSLKAVGDTKHVIQKGRAALLHVLCKIHEVMIGSGEFRYLYNDLFITDYCLWIQSVDGTVLEELQKEVANAEINKPDLGLDLEELEVEGRLAAMNVSEPQQLDSDDQPD